ncbi:EAL domain-containing protein [Halomonas sp. M4R5S39]|uniref:putative bifunctional diguanylate cyclase/phosphodiesterase n=1 Tax=Halomonas kalidii TaxID=3043293 RepID=UPI0024A877B0|nr:EAL domain-containing protein [Halomonas kalidii]MDI5987067.1 EAL domain-containing protein [Halomonas kalidii]
MGDPIGRGVHEEMGGGTRRARQRIVTLAMMGILATGALVGASTAVPLFHVTRDRLATTTLASVQIQADALDDRLRLFEELARQLASDEEIRRRLVSHADGELSRPSLVAYSAPRLRDAMAPSEELIGLVRRDSAGETLLSLGRTPLGQQEAQRNDGEASSPARLVQVGEALAVEVAAPILADNGAPIGTDLLYFRLDDLTALLADDDRFGAAARQYLVALDGGVLLTGGERGEPLVRAPDEVEGPRVQALGEGWSGLHRTGMGSREQVLIGVPAVTPGWGVLVVVPAGSFYAEVFRVLAWPLLATLAMMLLGALVTARALRPLLSRIDEQARRLEESAHYDALTRLPNRYHLGQRLEAALEAATSERSRLAVLFLDLDHFKGVNDSLGHPLGDRLLRAVGRRLSLALRDRGQLGRLGGDEFLVVIEHLSPPEAAEEVACQLIDALAEPFRVGGHEIFLGASIGISLFPEDGTTSEALIRNADTAMYRAKALKRNTWQRYTAALGEASRERFDLEVGLRRALERGELQLYFQPQAFIDGGRVFGAEALIRWVSPEGETIMPERFIPLAEESGLSHALGRWILGEACRRARQWELRGLDLQVAVNLSGAQVVHGDIVGDVRRVLQESGLSPERLELEITEGFLISHADEGIGVLHELRELGVMLAVDDFGTGYSSLAYLKRLPVQRLKIDQSFVRDVPGDVDDEIILAAILSMAGRLGLEVVAEGVELPVQLDFLAGLGCERYQGFLLSRPVPADVFDRRWGGGAELCAPVPSR